MCHHLFRKYIQGCDGHEKEYRKRIRINSDGISLLHDAQVEGAAYPADKTIKDARHAKTSRGDRRESSISFGFPDIAELPIS
jgi:hypothetical protein